MRLNDQQQRRNDHVHTSPLHLHKQHKAVTGYAPAVFCKEERTAAHMLFHLGLLIKPSVVLLCFILQFYFSISLQNNGIAQ